MLLSDFVLSSDAFDSSCDLRLIIEVGQLVQPWVIFLQVPYNTDHIT